MKKRLLLLPLFAGMVLSGCDFSLESLKFWEKKEQAIEDDSTTTDPDVAVAGVSVSPSSASLKVGETKQLSATVSPSDATNKSVSWSSSASSVASVSSSGLVTALSAGTATITATSVADSSKKASCTVTVSESGGETAKTFSSAVAEINSAFASHGVTAQVSLPEPAGFEYDQLDDYIEDDGSVVLWCLTSETEDSYYSKLDSAGYTVDTEDGEKYAIKGDFIVGLRTDEGYFGIIVCYVGEEGGGGGGDTEATYTLVTSNSALENGDVVVIKTEDGLGVTGSNNNKDATASSNESSWVRFVVGSASSSGWTLYDSGAGKYIATPTGNVFKYDTTGGTCSVDSEGHLVCNGRFLCFNSSGGEFYRFYTSIGSYTPFFVYAVSGGSGGGGGETVSDEFPAKDINDYLASVGSSATVSSTFSGTAKSFSFATYTDGAELDIEVEVGSEEEAIAAFAADLLASTNFEEDMNDIYGDMHYVSKDKKVDVCAWDGTYASTSKPGHVYVDFVGYSAPVSSLSLSEINGFLSDEQFGFSLTQAQVDSLNALASSFKVTLSYDSDNFGCYDILIVGNFESQINDIVKTTATSAGYSAKTTQAGYKYTNSNNFSVTIVYKYGVTLLEFY